MYLILIDWLEHLIKYKTHKHVSKQESSNHSVGSSSPLPNKEFTRLTVNEKIQRIKLRTIIALTVITRLPSIIFGHDEPQRESCTHCTGAAPTFLPWFPWATAQKVCFEIALLLRWFHSICCSPFHWLDPAFLILPLVRFFIVPPIGSLFKIDVNDA